MPFKQSQQEIERVFHELEERIKSTGHELYMQRGDGALDIKSDMNIKIIGLYVLNNFAGDFTFDNGYKAVVAQKNALTWVEGKGPKVLKQNTELAVKEDTGADIKLGLKQAVAAAKQKNHEEASKLMSEAKALSKSFGHNIHSKRARGQERMTEHWNQIVAPYMKPGAPTITFSQAESVMTAVKAALADCYKEVGV